MLAPTASVSGIEPFRDEAFKPMLCAGLEEGSPVAAELIGKLQRWWCLARQLTQALPPLSQGPKPEVLTIEVHQIECKQQKPLWLPADDRAQGLRSQIRHARPERPPRRRGWLNGTAEPVRL